MVDVYSPLHLTSPNGYVKIVKYLINFGKQNFIVDQPCKNQDRDARTLLHSAIVTSKINVIDMLLAHYVEATMEVTFHQESVLHLTVTHH